MATAELITDEAVCSTCEREQPSPDHDVLLHPIPHDITESQKEQFLALMSCYSCKIAKSPNDLGHSQVMKHHIYTNGAHLFDSRQEGFHYHIEKQYKPCYRRC